MRAGGTYGRLAALTLAAGRFAMATRLTSLLVPGTTGSGSGDGWTPPDAKLACSASGPHQRTFTSTLAPVDACFCPVSG